MKYARDKARKLEAAAKALDRAAKAMSDASGAIGVIGDCPHQIKAAWAEVDCALALIEEARK